MANESVRGNKIAILQVADTGPLESLVVMLQAVGYQCYLPSRAVKDELRKIGCALVLDVEDLVRGMGYERPFPIPEANMRVMEMADLFVDVKAHRDYEKIVRRWPNLEKKVLWYRINGGKPEHVIRYYEDNTIKEDCGNEIIPPCPVLTPNQWYRDGLEGVNYRVHPWGDLAYTCWPPFHRVNDYFPIHGRPKPGKKYTRPLCLIHNVAGWGYEKLIPSMRAMGVSCYGSHGSPDGLIPHSVIPKMLSEAICLVQLRSNDAPGYATYEALAAGCPVVCPRRLIWRCRMQDLLIPGKTCLVYDRETHDPLTDEDVRTCADEVQQHLINLVDPGYNKEIGDAGRQRLLEVMWNVNRDGPSLRSFMERHYP